MPFAVTTRSAPLDSFWVLSEKSPTYAPGWLPKPVAIAPWGVTFITTRSVSAPAAVGAVIMPARSVEPSFAKAPPLPFVDAGTGPAGCGRRLPPLPNPRSSEPVASKAPMRPANRSSDALADPATSHPPPPGRGPTSDAPETGELPCDPRPICTTREPPIPKAASGDPSVWKRAITTAVWPVGSVALPATTNPPSASIATPFKIVTRGTVLARSTTMGAPLLNAGSSSPGAAARGGRDGSSASSAIVTTTVVSRRMLLASPTPSRGASYARRAADSLSNMMGDLRRAAVRLPPRPPPHASCVASKRESCQDVQGRRTVRGCRGDNPREAS
jgi:hypothetical protein